MTFSTSGLSKIVDGGLTDGVGVWKYLSADDVTTVKAAGFFAGMGAGGHATNYGMKIGDVVIVTESTAGTVPGRTYMGAVNGSTADQASTSASSGFKASYDVTVQLSTTSS